MRKSTLKMEGSVKSSIEFPIYAHSAIICGQTNCGKTVFVLDLLENEYHHVFENIIILLPHHRVEQGLQKQELDW